MTDPTHGEPYQTILSYRSRRPASPDIAERNRDSLLNALDALAAGDGGPFRALFADDIVFHEAPGLPYGGTHRGIEAATIALGGIRQAFDRIYEEVDEVAAAGDVVMLSARVDYRVRRNGRSGSIDVLELFRFRDGKIVEWRAHYLDAAAVVANIGADR